MGVALYIPETARVVCRMSPTLARVKKFFTPSDDELKRIASYVRAVERGLNAAQGEFRTEAEFIRFVGASADQVRLTPPRLAVLEDVSADLSDFYDELVDDDNPGEPPLVVEQTGH